MKAADEQTTEVKCPQCGLSVNEWSGQGFAKEGRIYCCQGCAEGTGCICKSRKESKSDRELNLSEESSNPRERRAVKPMHG
jgi:hypothetical protein